MITSPTWPLHYVTLKISKIWLLKQDFQNYQDNKPLTFYPNWICDTYLRKLPMMHLPARTYQHYIFISAYILCTNVGTHPATITTEHYICQEIQYQPKPSMHPRLNPSYYFTPQIFHTITTENEPCHHLILQGNSRTNCHTIGLYIITSPGICYYIFTLCVFLIHFF